ncbi:hypothetical protein GQ54DRAFT_307487 [Martensiomyces pterosporus]|nr:hypothetical protein GQ54DRAFT_307487 [Martensiomyces pterosporus]
MFLSARAVRAARRRPSTPIQAAPDMTPSLWQGRRWKQFKKPSKSQPLPELDIEAILQAHPAIEVHNPLLEVEREHKRKQAERKQNEAEWFAQYIPKDLGSHPLTLEDEYMRRNMEFLREHDGIQSTPTRSYEGVADFGDVVNPKTSFGIVKIFVPFRDTDYKRLWADARYRDEFHFNKPALGHEYYLNHLDLYVKVLYTLPAEKRHVYLRDFFLIIKAIRQRPRIHGKLLDLGRFKLIILEYMLIAGQPNLAMCAAAMLIPKAVPEVLARWPIVRLLGLAPMYTADRMALDEIKTVQEGGKPTDAFSEREYNYNLLSHAILAYYYDRPEITMTDLEIVRLIRCAESRELTGDLMDMLPMIIRRFIEGPVKELPPLDHAELHYELKALEWHVSDMRLVMRYALAFGRNGQMDRVAKILSTVADMPAKHIEGTRGNTRDVARALARLVELGSSTENIVMATLEHFGPTSIEASLIPMTYVEYKAKLVEDIAKHLCAGEYDEGHAAAELLKALSVRFTPFVAMAMIHRLCQTSPVLGLSWMARNIHAFDEAAQKESMQWVAGAFRQDSELLVNFIRWNSKQSAVGTAQFIHFLSRRPWERETERLKVLSRAFREVSQMGDMRAAGVLLVGAALGPEMPAALPFGAQTPSERAKAVAKFAGSIKPDADGVRTVMPYLFKVAGSLKARETERILWRELLRRGIEPSWRMLQAALAMRLEQRYGGDQAIEITQHILDRAPISGKIEASAAEAHGTADEGDEASSETEDFLGDKHTGGGALMPSTMDGSALYITMLDGLNRGGLPDAVAELAVHLLDSGQLTNRTFGALASVWLDSVGFSPGSSRDDVQRVWNLLAGYVGEKEQGSAVYRFNQNHYHSAIEACVRKGDVNAAWYIVQVEMRAGGIKPTLKTFYTLISPLAQNSKLWPIGKSAVAKFNSYYPEIVKSAVKDNTNTLKVKALLHYTLN